MSSLLCTTWGKCWGAFFAVRVSSCSNTACWKHSHFSIELPWHLCRKSVNHIHEGLFLCLILFGRPLSTFKAIAHHPTHCGFTASLTLRQCNSPNRVLLVWNCFSYPRSFPSSCEVRMPSLEGITWCSKFRCVDFARKEAPTRCRDEHGGTSWRSVSSVQRRGKWPFANRPCLPARKWLHCPGMCSPEATLPSDLWCVLFRRED